MYAILFSWKKDKQDRHMWVPGGYILYILMEKLPGFSPERFYVDLDRAERDELRSKFKEAWLYVFCSVLVDVYVIRPFILINSGPWASDSWFSTGSAGIVGSSMQTLLFEICFGTARRNGRLVLNHPVQKLKYPRC